MDNWYKKQEGKRILNTIDKEKFIKDIKRDLGFRNEKFYKKEIDNEFNGFGNFENLEKTLNEIFNIKKEEEKILSNPNNIYITCKIKKEKEDKENNSYEKTINKKRIIEDNKIKKEETLIKIPKYIKNNQLIILKGKGNRNNNCIGNLIVKISVKQDKAI